MIKQAKKTFEKYGHKMQNMQNLFNSKRSQLFIISLVFIFTAGIITAFFLLGYLYDDKTSEEHLGTYQASIVDAFIDSDKTMIYLDSAAKSSLDEALRDFMKSGAVKVLAATGEDSDGPRCGSYVYNLWNSHYEDCFYDYADSFKEYMDASINRRLSGSSDINLAKPASGTYSFYDTGRGTEIKAKLDTQYDFFMFKTQKHKESLDLKNYLSAKAQYSGKLIWPLDPDAHINYISSCFGYRGPQSGGTVNHGGIDIPAPLGTAVIAAATGKVVELPNHENKGTVLIDHKNNFKTAYTHLSKHNVVLGQEVLQGEKIGEVGKTGTTNYHLHFEVIDNNLDPDLKFNGVPAYVKSPTRIKVNPLCFIDQEYLKEKNIVLSFNKDSIACNNICNTDKSVCSLNGCDKDHLCIYKFCSLYDIEKKCQTEYNDKWSIIGVSSDSIIATANQKINIIATLENPIEDCVTITPQIKIVRVTGQDGNTEIGKAYYVNGNDVDIYKKTQNVPVTEARIECSFTDDEKKSESELLGKRCLLSASKNEERYYKIQTFQAIDAHKRLLEKSEMIIIKVQAITASASSTVNTATSNTATSTVSESTTDSKALDAATSSNNAATIKLSNSELIKLESTKKALSQNTISDGTTWLEYIKKVSGENQIPPEIIFAMITQESSGKNYEKTGSNNAVGIMQVEPHQHVDSINSVCGKQYTAECNKKYEPCPFNSFHSDIKCQIDVAIVTIKKNFETYSKDNKYTSAVKKICTIPDRQQKYLSYTGWERALRAYNGFGCIPGKGDYEYVEHIMKWANAWGYDYSQQYYAISKDEISKGIVGTYKIEPAFSVYTDFDFSILRRLSETMKSTIQDCKSSSKTRSDCVDDHVKAFNVELKNNPARINAELTRECDTDVDESLLNKFVEELEECRDSTAGNCQCLISHSQNDFLINISSGEETSTLTSGQFSAKIYGLLNDIDNKLLNRQVNLKNVTMVKIPTGELMIGTASSACNPIKSMFRLCLKTDYKVSVMESNKYIEEELVLRYAITIRDNVPPAAVSSLTVISMPHTTGNIMLSWPKNKDNDIAGYNIYVADTTNDIISGKGIKISIDVSRKSYETFKSLNYDKEPECNVQNNLYCEFLYKGIKTENNAEKEVMTALFSDKLYNIESTSSLLYIISGSDSRIKLVPGKQKYIAITAYDIDGNELPLITNGKATQGIPIKQIMPKDSVEPGFVYPIYTTFDPNNKDIIVIRWDMIKFEMNGLIITDPSSTWNIIYNIYTSKTSCDLDYIGSATIIGSTTTTDYKLNNIASDVKCIFVIAERQSLQYPKACMMIRYDDVLLQPDNFQDSIETCVNTNPLTNP